VSLRHRGAIFDLRAGLDGLEDEDMIATTVFQGMPTWDAVMSSQYGKDAVFRDPEIRKSSA